MSLYTEYQTKKGTLISTDGFNGEEDFYRMHQIIHDLLAPDDIGFSVDSMATPCSL